MYSNYTYNVCYTVVTFYMYIQESILLKIEKKKSI